MTATGSVGEIRAPKTKHQIGGTARPRTCVNHRKPKPTNKVEAMVPTVLRTRDRPEALFQIVPANMHGPREQQEGQHAVHQGGVKINMVEEVGHGVGQPATWHHVIDGYHAQREPIAPIMVRPIDAGNLKKAMIDIAEDSRQNDKDSGRVKGQKAAGTSVCLTSRFSL